MTLTDHDIDTLLADFDRAAPAEQRKAEAALAADAGRDLLDWLAALEAENAKLKDLLA